MRDLGDRVLVIYTQRGRAKGSGGELSGLGMYGGAEEALEAAGLSE